MKLLISAGGTAGHFFPAASLISSLEKIDSSNEIILVITKRQVPYSSFLKNKCKILFFDIDPINISLNLQNVLSVVKFIIGFVRSFYLCTKARPDVVVGFGGYASFVVVLAGILSRIPTIIHEQNVAPGRANRILAAFVDRISVSFLETQIFYNSKRRDAVLTGNPIRKDLRKIQKSRALEYLNLDKDRFTILIMGGSQGSHAINTAFIECLGSLSKDLVNKIQVIHITGKGDYSFIFNKYQSLSLNSCIFEFFKDMSFAYSCCDLAISRAGAMSITEISFMAVASILIPYPFAYGHQWENARFLSSNGACIVIEEGQLNKDVLRERIIELIQNPNSLRRMRSNVEKLYKPNAADTLAKEIVNLTNFETNYENTR